MKHSFTIALSATCLLLTPSIFARQQQPDNISYSDRVITLFANTPPNSPDYFPNGPIQTAKFGTIGGIVSDKTGTIYISDKRTHSIRKYFTTISTLAGTGKAGYKNGNRQQAQFIEPGVLTIDGAGNLYVIEGGDRSSRVRIITQQGTVNTYLEGAANASINGPRRFRYILADANGTLYATFENSHAIYRIAADKKYEIIAGSQTAGNVDGVGGSAQFNQPNGLALDPDGNILVADQGNNSIRKITKSGTISTIVKGLANPNRLIVDSDGNLLITDKKHRLMKWTPGGKITMLADRSTMNAGGFDASAAPKEFNDPQDILIHYPDVNLMFYDKVGLRTLRATAINPIASTQEKTKSQQPTFLSEQMPPANTVQKKLRLIRGTALNKMFDSQVRDSSFILFQYNVDGYLYKVTEYVRIAKKLKSNIADINRQYHFVASITIEYDSLNRPGLCYSTEPAAALAVSNLFSGNGMKEYFRYNEKNQLIESGKNEVDIIARYTYNEAGDQIRESTIYPGNRIGSYITHEKTAGGLRSERFVATANNVMRKQFTITGQGDGKKGLAQAFWGTHTTRPNIGLVKNIPFSGTDNPLRSIFTAEGDQPLITQYTYTYQEDGLPATITIKQKDQITQTYAFEYSSAESEPDFNLTINDRSPFLKPATPIDRGSCYRVNAAANASDFSGRWIADETMPNSGYLRTLSINTTSDKKGIYAQGASTETGMPDIPSGQTSLNSINNGSFVITHTYYNKKRQSVKKYTMLADGRLKVFSKEIYGNPKSNFEYYTYLKKY